MGNRKARGTKRKMLQNSTLEVGILFTLIDASELQNDFAPIPRGYEEIAVTLTLKCRRSSRKAKHFLSDFLRCASIQIGRTR